MVTKTRHTHIYTYIYIYNLTYIKYIFIYNHIYICIYINPWLKICASDAGATGLIPGWGTQITGYGKQQTNKIHTNLKSGNEKM